MSGESPKRPGFTDDIRIGEWLVQPSIDRMSRRDVVVRLRPQLTDLLVLLARHAGSTVPRDVILQEVWASQYVGESGLSRCIAELRQALDDDARQPRVLETIPKRGYRLVAPVEFLPGSATGGNGNGNGHGNGSTPGGDAATAAPAIASVQVPPDLVPPSASHARASAKRSTAGRLLRGVPWLLLGVAVVVGIVVTLASAEWGTPPLVSERDTILLADVRNETGDRVFDGTLRLALASGLEQVPFLRIMSQDAVRAALVRSGRSPDEPVVGPVALDVCRREGGAILLAGSIARLGSRYAVGLEAIACGSGESLGGALAEAKDKEHVLAALEQVTGRMRIKLGESRRSLRQHDAALVHATTPSLDALKALTLGDFNRDHARVSEALALYRQATTLDPEFAVAWARRGAAAWTLGLTEDAVPSFRRAYELRDRVSTQERFYIEAHYYEFVAVDPAKAVETYRAWKRLYPGSVVPPVNLVFVLGGMLGQYDAALPEAREAVRLAPDSSLSCVSLAEAYLGLGRVADARQAIAAATSRGVDDGMMHALLLNVALLEDDSAGVERAMTRVAGSPTETLLALRIRASAAAARGRRRQAAALWSQALAKTAEIGLPKRIADIRIEQAEADALVGDARAVRPALDAALTTDRSARALTSAAIVFALAGDAPRARTLLDEVGRQATSDLPSAGVWLPMTRALVAARLGRADEAVALLQPIAGFERGGQFHLVPLGVRAIVEQAAGRPANAAAAFDTLLQMRALEAASSWVPYARIGLARALAASGDGARSVAAYDAFLESWKDADSDAPLVTAARRERTVLAASLNR